jgi:ABC-type spermidine/putrescine transport system permease subunit II
LLVTGVAAVVGTAFAFLLVSWHTRYSAVFENVIALPLAVPGVVLGISMVMTASLLHIPPGFGRLLLGHLVFVMPVILLVVSNRLRRIDPNFALASRDLGADWWRTLLRIQLPMIRSAIVGGALLGYTLSIDEVMVSLFLYGSTPTLPVYVWNQTRFGFTPAVNAIFTCIGVISLILVIAGQRLLASSMSQRSDS